MITITGNATLKVPYEVEIDMTEAQFDALPISKQNELIDSAIDWKDACRSGEVDDIEIDELVEAEDEPQDSLG